MFPYKNEFRDLKWPILTLFLWISSHCFVTRRAFDGPGMLGPRLTRFCRPRKAQKHPLLNGKNLGRICREIRPLPQAFQGFAVSDADEVEDAVEADGGEGLARGFPDEGLGAERDA